MELRPRLLVWLVTAALVLGASAAHAQQPAPRVAPSGTWMGFGIGGGWVRVTCTICRTDRFPGPSGYLRFGTTLRPGLLIAGEAAGWTRSEDDVRSIVGTGGAAAYVYPDPDGGLFLKGGLGFVRYSAGGGEAASNLFGLLVGAGYDFALTSELNVTNYVQLVASSFGSHRMDRATVADDISLSLIQIGIGLTTR